MLGENNIELNIPTRMKVYRFVVNFKASHDGLAPTVREIGAALHLCPSNVHHHLEELQKQGLIAFIGSCQSRGIVVCGGSWRAPEGVL